VPKGDVEPARGKLGFVVEARRVGFEDHAQVASLFQPAIPDCRQSAFNLRACFDLFGNLTDSQRPSSLF